MSGEMVSQMVHKLVGGKPELDELQNLLGVTFKQTDENPSWTFFEFELPNGPFRQGEFRLSKAEGQALLSLVSREGEGVTEPDLNLRKWGEARSFNVSPRIPPEGAVAYVYDIEGVKVSFQLHQTSRQLRTLVFEWGAE